MAGLQIIMLAMTYSRGGYLAALTATTLAALAEKNWRGWVVPLLILAVILLTVDGGSRIRSATQWEEGSIRNRLLLWHGGMAIAARHWATGIGAPPAAGNLYTAYDQPLWLEERYHSMVSDYMTLATAYGLIWLTAGLLAVFSGIGIGWCCWRGNRDPLLLYALAAIVGYLVCGLFSTGYASGWIMAAWAAAWGVVALFVLRDMRRYGFRPRPAIAGWAFGAAAGIALLLGGYGGMVYHNRPFHWQQREIGNSLPLLELSPRQETRGTVILAVSHLETAIRPVLRPLVEKGWHVIGLETAPGTNAVEPFREAAQQIRATLPDDKPVWLGAPDAELSLVVLAAGATGSLQPDWDGIATFNLPSDWPFAELSPVKRLDVWNKPLILASDQWHIDATRKLAEGGTKRILPEPADNRTPPGVIFAEVLNRCF